MNIQHNLISGTVISVPKNVINHVGIITGRHYTGIPTVIANTPKYGEVVEQTLDDFCNGMDYKVIYRPKNYIQGYKAVQRATQLIGKPYGVLTYNCEHLISDAYSFKPESLQLQGWTIFSLLIGTGLLFLSTSKE